MTFALHEMLAADTEEVTQLDLCRVLLMNDATYPWLILVPEMADLRDLHDVPAEQHTTLMAEIGRASRALQALHAPDKMNVAALGNQVPQLHIHVIARRADDPAWPGPVWGVAPARAYSDAGRSAALDGLRRALAAA